MHVTGSLYALGKKTVWVHLFISPSKSRETWLSTGFHLPFHTSRQLIALQDWLVVRSLSRSLKFGRGPLERQQVKAQRYGLIVSNVCDWTERYCGKCLRCASGTRIPRSLTTDCFQKRPLYPGVEMHVTIWPDQRSNFRLRNSTNIRLVLFTA